MVAQHSKSMPGRGYLHSSIHICQTLAGNLPFILRQFANYHCVSSDVSYFFYYFLNAFLCHSFGRCCSFPDQKPDRQHKSSRLDAHLETEDSS
jgi:hypothetical protein